ncbi:putative conjugative transposon protein [Clostridioides difficile CD178]|nr:putative conjugative transposon protein [Clostridioides difficile CD178]EQG47832.1 putative conjugative transposon protein [Clostridioides difficile DA00134]
MLWNICLAPKQQRSGEFLKGGYRYFAGRNAYRVFQNLGICG